MPTNTTIPTVSTGGTASAAEYNYLSSLNTTVGLFNTAGSISGSPPAPTAPNFYIQAGTSVVTTSSGVASIAFPTAFPNGLLTLTVCAGDTTNSLAQTPIINSGTNDSGFSCNALTATGSSVGSVLVRINWIAVGW